MCTLALFFNVLDAYPLLVAANRDEHYDRPAAPPGLIASNPRIVAGKDLRAGGTWLGVNEHGLLVAILNRRANGGTEVPLGSRSRGLLCLDLLGLPSARQAGELLSERRDTYSPFALVYADRETAGVAYNKGGEIIVRALGEGVHVFSSAAELDVYSDKADRARSRFSRWANGMRPATKTPDLLEGLREVLCDHTVPDGGDPRDAVCVHGDQSGTVSSSIVCYPSAQRCFHSYYCPGPPCRHTFSESLTLDVL